MAGFDEDIDGLQHELTLHQRESDRSPDLFILEDDQGTPYLNTDGPGGINERVGELTTEKAIRERIRDKIKEYKEAVDRAIAALRTAIKRLENAINSTKGKGRKPERDKYREVVDAYKERLGELKTTSTQLGRDWDLAKQDVTDVEAEIASVSGTAAPKTDDKGGPADAGPDAQAAADQITRRADGLAADLKAARSNLAAFLSPGDIGAGGANAWEAAGGGYYSTPFAGVGQTGGGTAARRAAGGAEAGGLVVQIQSFVPPTGQQAAEVAGMVAGALDTQAYRSPTVVTVGTR